MYLMQSALGHAGKHTKTADKYGNLPFLPADDIILTAFTI